MSDETTEPTPPVDELSAAEVSEQKAVRLSKRERLISSGREAYPVAVPVTTTIPALREKYGHLVTDDTTGDVVGIAGRMVFARNTGKLCFATLQAGDGSRVQAMVSLAEVGQESLDEWKEFTDLGDHVFVSGEVISSRRGELSVLARRWRIALRGASVVTTSVGGRAPRNEEGTVGSPDLRSTTTSVR